MLFGFKTRKEPQRTAIYIARPAVAKGPFASPLAAAIVTMSGISKSLL